MSGFFDTELDAVLRNLDVTTLLFAGPNLDRCVLATLADAACLGYDFVLIEGCSGTPHRISETKPRSITSISASTLSQRARPWPVP